MAAISQKGLGTDLWDGIYYLETSSKREPCSIRAIQQSQLDPCNFYTQPGQIDENQKSRPNLLKQCGESRQGSIA